MKRILLTSTALVMVAGIAAADGHASVSWSGTATAGVARNGGAEAAAAVAAAATLSTDSDSAHRLRNAATLIRSWCLGTTMPLLVAVQRVETQQAATAITAAEARLCARHCWTERLARATCHCR